MQHSAETPGCNGGLFSGYCGKVFASLHLQSFGLQLLIDQSTQYYEMDRKTGKR
jgi:hypothetical protein